MTTTAAKVKTAKEAALEALATLGGFLAANFSMSLAEKFVPAMAVPAVGALGIVPHLQNANDYARAFGNGMLAAGASEGLKQLTGGKAKDSLVDKINKALPGRGTFAGFGYVQNGGFPLRGFAGYEVDSHLLNGGAPTVDQRLLSDSYLSM